MDKQQEFKVWLDNQIANEKSNVCKEELENIKDCLGGKLWSFRVEGRHLDLRKEFVLHQDLPTLTDITKRLASSTSCVNKLKSMGVIQ